MHPLTRSISRRRLLRAGSLTLAGAWALPTLARPRRRAGRVVVVGAGPAGLAAAWELSRAGHEVVVLEARDRAGGRMHTLRDGFDDGLYAEAGALFLTSHNPGLDYARELGLELVEIEFERRLASVVCVDGARLPQRRGEPCDWPGELNDGVDGRTADELKGLYHYGAIARLPGIERTLEDGPTPEDLTFLDGLSLTDFWRSQGASPSAVRLMSLGYFSGYGEGPDTTNALQCVREAASLAGSTAGYRVSGGNDRICAAMAERLADRVRFGSPVRAVEQDDAGVTVLVERDGDRERVTADAAVITPPPQVLRDVEFTPELSRPKARALRDLVPTDTTRVLVQARRRVWHEQGLSGTAATDLPVGGLFHASIGQAGERGILDSFTTAERARAMAGLDEAKRVEVATSGMNVAFPGFADAAEGGTSYAWGDDPWARGSFAAFAVGQDHYLEALREPEGRLFFAGDTVGGVPGYSHAAFASGRRAAERVGVRLDNR